MPCLDGDSAAARGTIRDRLTFTTRHRALPPDAIAAGPNGPECPDGGQIMNGGVDTCAGGIRSRWAGRLGRASAPVVALALLAIALPAAVDCARAGEVNAHGAAHPVGFAEIAAKVKSAVIGVRVNVERPQS